MKYRHYTFESTTHGLADLLIDDESTKEPDFDPRDYIVNDSVYQIVTDDGTTEIDDNITLPEYLINQ